MSGELVVAAIPGATVSFRGFPAPWRAAIATFLSGFTGDGVGATLVVAAAAAGAAGGGDDDPVEWLVDHPPLRGGRGPSPGAVRLSLPGSVTDVLPAAGTARVTIAEPDDRGAPLEFVSYALVPLLQELAAPLGIVGVHAAAVAWKGRAVLLAGPSGCGKSTLFARAAEGGLDLLSDDLAWLVPDREGWTVHPFPRGAPAAPARAPTVASARLALLARPVVAGGPASRAVPLPAAGAIELLGAEAPLLASGAVDERFRALVRIAGTVASVRFEVSGGAADAAAAMRELLGG